MKPAPFGYERPRDLQAALAVLNEADASAKIIAGGQSLGPMLNLRLVEPQLIVDITGLAELKQAERHGDEIVLGACVTHAEMVIHLAGASTSAVARCCAHRNSPPEPSGSDQ